MQLSTFPLFPGLPSGLPTGKAAAPAAVGTGASADSATGFGEMLTAESAAATPGQPASASAGGAAASAHPKATLNHASTNGRPGGHPARGANAAGLVNGATVALPASNASDTPGANGAMGSVGTASGANVETADGVPIDLIPDTTIANTALLEGSAAQPQVVVEWVAPAAPESSAMELFGFSATRGSGEIAAGTEDGDGEASTPSLNQPGAAPIGLAGPAMLGRAAGVPSASFPIGISASTAVATDASMSTVAGGSLTRGSPVATATRGGAFEQVSAQASDASVTNSPVRTVVSGVDSAVPDPAMPVQPMARSRTAALIKSAPVAGDTTVASDPLPRMVSSSQPAISASVVVPDSATERDLPVSSMSPSDAATAKIPTQAQGALANDAEKIAAGFSQSEGGQGSAGKQDQRNSLPTDDKSVRMQAQRLGTNTAKSEPPMVASAQTTRSLIAEPEAMPLSAVPLTFDAMVEEAAQAVEYSGSARKAVDAAMSLLDQSAKGTQRSVNLQFSVSGVDVAVRVEMRDDQVHTTFRTDSPEIRAALAQEWQTVVSTQSADRSQKLADPVFTSSANAGATSGDAGASQQREPSTRHGQWENTHGFASSFAARGSEAASSAESQPGRAVRPETTRHLDAVA